MLDRRVFLILVLAVLCGCGGGGGGGNVPSASATPSASPDPEAAADPAAALAERRDAIRAEMRAYRALKPRQGQLLYWKLDGLALTLGSRHFRADTRRRAPHPGDDRAGRHVDPRLRRARAADPAPGVGHARSR